MSMLPMWRTCLKCGTRWSYNPSVNQITCPNCAEKMKKKAKKISDIIPPNKKNGGHH